MIFQNILICIYANYRLILDVRYAENCFRHAVKGYRQACKLDAPEWLQNALMGAGTPFWLMFTTDYFSVDLSSVGDSAMLSGS